MNNYIYGMQGNPQFNAGFNPSPYAHSNIPGEWNQQPNAYSAYNTGQGPYHLGGQGPYVIRSKLTGRCLDISQTNDWGNQVGDLILYNYVGGKNQQFQLENNGQDITIRCVKSGKVLDSLFEGNRPVNTSDNTFSNIVSGPRVRENTANGSNGQRWRFQETAPGSNEYVIYCATGKVMDVANEDGSNNMAVIPYDYHGRNNQVWYVTPVSSTPLAPN